MSWYPRRARFVLACALTGLMALTPGASRAQEVPAPPPVDTVPPLIALAADVVVTAVDPAGTTVAYAVPIATDDIDGAVAVACAPAPESFFVVGTTTVSCAAQDAAGNVAVPVAFAVTVLPPPVQAPTEPATPPSEAPLEPGSPPTEVVLEPAAPPPIATDMPEPPAQATPAPTAVPPSVPSASPSPTPEESPTPETATTLPPPPALDLPSPPPPAPFYPITGSGPLGALTSIWGGLSFPISQEYGHTEFSLGQPSMYRYGLDYGLDGRAHPGLDVGMPAGTPLYAPVAAEVVVAGGTPYFTFYKNGEPGVGELLLRTEAGHEVVLGHMGRIVVRPGDHVAAGQFVGLSGGENGDHLHLEVREAQAGGGLRVVDPRQSFLIAALDSDATVAPPDTAPVAGDDSVPELPADHPVPPVAPAPPVAEAAPLPEAERGNVQTASQFTDHTPDGLNGPSPGTSRAPRVD